MSASGVTGLPVDGCFSVLVLYKPNLPGWFRTNKSPSSRQEVICPRHHMATILPLYHGIQFEGN
jgi:hypothetical protein